MNHIATILASLKQQKADLAGQLSRVNAAISALAVGSTPKKKAVKKQTAKKGKGRKPMTAAQKKLVSNRMKKYWAKRKKAKG